LRHFAVELEELNQALLEMGALVESSIHCSVQSLVDRDERMALRVIEDENRINRMELDIDARVTRLLALNQPVAGDLRLLIIALKINTDLERMGDLAVNIAERAISLSKAPPVKPLIDTPRMASLVEDMLHRSLDAFVQRDAKLAEKVLPADDEVDSLRDRIYAELLDLMQHSPNVVPHAIHLMFVARNLERIADHTTNIAEDVIFLVRGIDVRHHATETRPS
jgi:phosphate transport system protein